MGSQCKKQRKNSQIKQRLVDVSLRDILRWAFESLPKTFKRETIWKISTAIRGGEKWRYVAKQLANKTEPSSGNMSEYFWATLLAATAKTISHPLNESTIQSTTELANSIAFTINNNLEVFSTIRYPRGRTGNQVHTIKEILNQESVKYAASIIAQGIIHYMQSIDDVLFAIELTGVVISPDLWRHPSAVHYLLIPLMKTVRKSNGSFSLDKATDANNPKAEEEINERLGKNWQKTNAW